MVQKLAIFPSFYSSRGQENELKDIGGYKNEKFKKS